jgi:photosystem II stability/assembly factor-like uncharacterized protein
MRQHMFCRLSVAFGKWVRTFHDLPTERPRRQLGRGLPTTNRVTFGMAATLAAAGLAACAATSARPTPTATISPLPTHSPLSSPTSAADPPPPGPDVSGAHVVDGTHGWALVDSPILAGCCSAPVPQRLEWTADAGTTWTDITPPSARGDSLIGVDFRTEAEGWAVIAGEPSLPPLISHTMDAGRAWTTQRFPSGQAVYGNYSSAAIAFSDASRGWVVVDEGSNSNSFYGIGYRTVDGGRSWTALSVPALGAVYFTTATDGWILGNWAPGGGFYVTHDAGTTWVASSVPPPSGYAADVVSYGPPGPDLLMAGSPVVEAAFSDPTSGTVVAVGFYVSHDFGHSWSLSGMYRVPEPDGNAFSSAIVSDATWWLSPPEWPHSSLVITADSGATWSTRTSPAPQGASVGGLTFADLDHGWALVNFSGCLMYKSDCFSATRLYGTQDGAVIWRALNP